MTSYVFLSFVGTQNMGVVFPLEACLNTPEKVSIGKILLIASGKAKDFAETIKNYCEKKNYPPVDVLDWPLGKTEGIVELAEMDGPILFNATGGLNFACASITHELVAHPDAAIVVSTQNAALLCKIPSQEQYAQKDFSLTCEHLNLPVPKPVEELLAIQNASWKKSEQTSFLFEKIQQINATNPKASAHIKLPKNRIENIVLGSTFFDLAWVDNTNTLHLLRDLCLNGSSQRSDELQFCRELSSYAATRDETQIYDREVHVLCPGPSSAEHIVEESRNKARAYNCRVGDAKLEEILKSILGEQEVKDLPAKGIRHVSSNTLVVAMGTDESPTLKAIASHKLSTLMLCCTSDLEEKALRLKNMIDNGEFKFGHCIEQVSIVPSDHAGSFLMRNLKLDKKQDITNVQVNITPGTKGQSVFLSLWAGLTNASVWSIKDKQITRLDQSEENNHDKPVEGFDAVNLLELRYTKDKVTYAQSPSKTENTLYDLLLQHMTLCREQKQNWILSRVTTAERGASQSFKLIKIQKIDLNLWEVTNLDGQSYKLDTANGEWLEKLTAHAFRKMGAQYVYSRVRVLWDDVEKSENAPHRIDMDVVGTWLGESFLVSCKSGKPDLRYDTEEAKSMAASISRFTIPFLCAPQIDTPILEDTDAVCFGWRELCDKNTLIKLVNYAYTRKKTTITTQKPNTN